jgi:hypothetical protein
MAPTAVHFASVIDTPLYVLAWQERTVDANNCHMLTRGEVEGGLRSLDPMRFEKRRVHRVRSKARRRAQSGVGLLLGIVVLAASAVVLLRAAGPAVATLQDSEWPDGHVSRYRRQDHPPLFPPQRRSPWDSFAARAHAPRDPITGARRYSKLARE